MSDNLNTPPPGWGEDDLTDYIFQATNNRWATFVHESAAFNLLRNIDIWLERLRKGLINPKSELSAVLFLRAQLLFRSCCETSMSGNLFATMPLQRTCIETAAYAVCCARDSEMLQVWMEREDTEDSKKKARNRFTFGAIKSALAKLDRDIAETYDELYQRSIDFGAHPNPHGVWTSASVAPAGRNIEIAQIALHGRGVALDAALKSTAQSGVFVVRAAEMIWPERVQILGLNDQMWALRGSC